MQGNYLEGLPDGVQEQWYPSGQISRRWIAVRGQGSSERWPWYRDGMMRSYRRSEAQQTIHSEAWEEDGRPIEPGTLPEDGSAAAVMALKT